jgi:hypothetical protein
MADAAVDHHGITLGKTEGAKCLAQKRSVYSRARLARLRIRLAGSSCELAQLPDDTSRQSSRS